MFLFMDYFQAAARHPLKRERMANNDPTPWRPLTSEEIREIEAELDKPILPPSDWKERALSELERARKILRESPMGRGRI